MGLDGSKRRLPKISSTIQATFSEVATIAEWSRPRVNV